MSGTKNIAIFASGTGSNARKIIEYFQHNARVNVAIVIASKATAGVLDIAKEHHIETLVLEKEKFSTTEILLFQLEKHEIDFIVLAGFLWKIPDYLLRNFSNKIINIHPSLLPKFGGKGMYGSKVHEAVVAAGEKKSGITIHFVNKVYDDGEVVFQAECEVKSSDTPEEVAANVLKLEHEHFSTIIEKVIAQLTY